MYSVWYRSTITLVKHLSKCTKISALQSKYYTSAQDSMKFSNLKSFGLLKINTKQNALFVIRPVDPVKNPEQNQAFLRVSEGNSFLIENTDDCITTSDPMTSKNQESEIYCQYHLPLKYDVSAKVVEADVHVVSMESENITIENLKGACQLKNIKSENVHIKSGGPVVAESLLHANGCIETEGNMPVNLEKCMGSHLSVITDTGNVAIAALYVEQCDITTNSGAIKIGACHRSTDINIKQHANLDIGSLDGNLNAYMNKGDVDIYFSKIGQVQLHVKEGNVSLKLSDSLCCQLELYANSVNISSELNITDKITEASSGKCHVKGNLHHSKKDQSLLPEEKNLLSVTCTEGSISIIKQDWFSSLRLGS